jgi:hypothetical protein
MKMTKFCAGDWVEVRSKEEILRTLDQCGRLQGLPFMPQMFKYCGQRFQVYRRAHKTCDTVNPVAGRRLADCIHLSLRCDGQNYGGCQAACLIFWKEAWLKPVAADGVPVRESGSNSAGQATRSAEATSCTEENVLAATRVGGMSESESTRYSCQATELPRFTTPLPWWDLSQYLEDYQSGNITLGRMFCGLVYVCYYYGTMAWRDKIGIPSRWLYDRIQSMWGGVPFPRRKGTIPIGQSTPTSSLNLQPGELVRVKSYEAILATIHGTDHHRGLHWDAEQVPYCGGTYRVQARIERFLDEKTGKLISLKTPAVILENVWCQARYSDCRMFCPRSIYSWWREVWLERVDDKPSGREEAKTCAGEGPSTNLKPKPAVGYAQSSALGVKARPPMSMRSPF